MSDRRLSCASPSRRGPVWPNRSEYAVESVANQLADEEPRRIDRAGHDSAALGYPLEAGFAVVRFIAYEHDQAVTLGFCLGEGTLDQGITDPAFAKCRLHRERPKQQRLGLTDANRGELYRPDQQGADSRRERQFRSMTDALAQSVRRLGIAARAEGALMQALNRHRVIGRFRQDRER